MPQVLPPEFLAALLVDDREAVTVRQVDDVSGSAGVCGQLADGESARKCAAHFALIDIAHLYGYGHELIQYPGSRVVLKSRVKIFALDGNDYPQVFGVNVPCQDQHKH